MNQQYILWTDLQDIIGKANLWPLKIRKLFWTRNVKHFDRLLIAAFAYVNGLNPVVFMEWADLIQMCRDQAARNHFIAIFKLFEEGRNYRLYAYNVTLNQYQYIDGSVHHYTHLSHRRN